MSDFIKRMMALTQGKAIRQPTQAENYLQNFWVPAPGNIVFSPDHPGEELTIEKIEKEYPEQAIARSQSGDPKVIYLQDWHWSPKSEELDEILKGMGVRVYDDMLQRNQKFIRKPHNNDEYVKVIRTIRMYAYEEGDDITKSYFQGVQNASD